MLIVLFRYLFQSSKLFSFWIVIFLFQVQALQAQTNSSEMFFADDKRHEIGVNITTVLFSALGNSSTQIDPGRFPWSYKYRFKKGNAFRLGVGVNFKAENEDFRQFSSFNQFASLRMGYEWRVYLDKRWLSYLGLDVLGDLSDEQAIVSNQFDFTVIRLTSIGVGGGPVFGIQFAASNRIILGTEASIYGIYSERVRTETFTNNPDSNDRIESSQISGELSVPRWLYLSIRF